MSDLNLFQRLSQATTALKTVGKNLTVSTGVSSYKAVSERDVKDAIKPVFSENGIYAYPVSKEIIDDSLLEDAKGRRQRYLRMKVTMRFVNVDKPSEYIDVVGYGDGIDSGDKAPGKADTYACKYCYLSALAISTGDDPDQDASPVEGYKNAKATAWQVTWIREHYDAENIAKMLSYYHLERLEDMDFQTASQVIKRKQNVGVPA